MSAPAWLPMYWGDYIKDTRHLTVSEKGIYSDLIGLYSAHGSLPDDEARLARMVGATPDEWAAARPAVSAFFQPGWQHKRIDAELAAAEARSTAARDKATKRWRGKPAPNAPAYAAALPELVLGTCNSQSQSQKEREEVEGASLRAAPLAHPQNVKIEDHETKETSRSPEIEAYASTEEKGLGNVDHDGDASTSSKAPSLDPDSKSAGTALAIIPTGGALAKAEPKSKRGSRMGEAQQPTDADLRHAALNGLLPNDIRREWPRFRDHHIAKGSVMADWSAAWRTWLRNAKEFARSNQRPAQRETMDENLQRFAAASEKADGDLIGQMLGPRLFETASDRALREFQEKHRGRQP
jgi:uncharacterized protein YdaU (DUF1376 family)